MMKDAKAKAKTNSELSVEEIKAKTNSKLSVEEIKKEARKKAFGDTTLGGQFAHQIKYDPITPNISKIEANDRLAGSVEGDTAYVSREEFFAMLIKINQGRELKFWEFAGSPKDQWEKLMKNPYFIDLLQMLNSGQIDRVEKYFTRAIEEGYITIWDGRAMFYDHSHGHKGQRRELAWFIRAVLSPNYDQIIPYSQIEALFNIRRLEVETNKLFDRIKTPQWEPVLYDKIFYD